MNDPRDVDHFSVNTTTEPLPGRLSQPLVLAVCVFAVVALACAGVISLLEQRRMQNVQSQARLVVADKADEIQRLIGQTLSATYVLGALVSQGGGEFTDFQKVGTQMLINYPGAASLQLVPDGVLGDVVPLTGNESSIGHNMLANPKRNKEALIARKTGRLTLSGPFELLQGGMGAVGRLPIYLPRASDGERVFWGFTAVLMRFPDVLIAADLPQLHERGFHYELTRTHPYTGARQIIMASPGAALVDPVHDDLMVPDSKWRLSASPVGGWRHPGTLLVHGALGLLFSLLLAWLAKQMVELRHNRRGLRALVARRTSQLADREADLQRAQAVAGIGSWVLDRDSDTRRLSPQASQVFATGEAVQLDHATLIARVHPQDREAVSQVWQLTRQGMPSEIEYRLCVGEGHRWLRELAECRRNAGSDDQSIVGTVQDITEQKTREDVIWRQANFDPLTGLANRHMLHDRLERALRRAKRNESCVGLIFLDLDGFKWVNDTLGHDVGDQLLVQVADRLRQCVRQQDTVARLGGDEFTVIVDDIEHTKDVLRIAEKMLEVLRVPYALGGTTRHLSGSAGLTLYPDDGSDVQTLLRNADIAMYQAKQLGKDRAQFYAPHMQTRAHERMDIESQLRQAIARQEFELHYQPIVLTSSGELVGAEALIRWRHPERGLVLPQVFIPVAEETGMILPIGEWALNEAMRQLAQWNADGLPPLRMAVNISSVQFRNADLCASVERIRGAHAIGINTLTLEITESTLMDDSSITETRMHEIKALGVNYSLDDFGTGYSSLSCLKRFPVDMVKIDRSFVHECAEGQSDAPLVAAIIQMAHSLNLKVTAEGVETDAQREFLRDLGCDCLQGYLISRPVTAEVFERFARSAAAATAKVDVH